MKLPTTWLAALLAITVTLGVPATAQVASEAVVSADLRIVESAERRDLETIRVLIEEGVSVNAPQADQATALAWAVHWNDLMMAEVLIAAGADVGAANDLGVTPLMLACENGSSEMVGMLLQAGAEPNVARSNGETALMVSARTGNVDVVRLLVSAGAEVDLETNGEHTALMWASSEGHAGVVRVLTEVGADVSARTSVYVPQARQRIREAKVLGPFEAVNPADVPRDGDSDPPRAQGGFTPLLYAVLAGNLNVVRVLVAAGADIDEAGPDGVTAVLLALTKRHEEIALYLLERGADARPAEVGYSALHMASATGQILAARKLLESGADPDARMEMPQRLTTAFETGVFSSPGSGRLTQKGSTPFIVAAKSADAAMMNLLVEAGADPYLTTEDQTTALMMAAGLGKRAASDITYYDWTEARAVAAVSVALQVGVEVNAANAHGETAMHAAAYHNATEVIDTLLKAGADINALNAAEQTPLRIAEGHLICCTTFVRHSEAAEYLSELGANPEAGIQLTFGLTNFGDDVESAGVQE